MTISNLQNDFSHIQEKPYTGCPEMGRKIKELRLLRGFSQSDLGNIVGVTFQQIQKYESGKNAISIDKLCAIAKALSVDVTVLLPTPQVSNGPTALHEDSNGFQYDSDEECEIENDMLNLMRGYRKIKSKELRKIIQSLVKSLSVFEESSIPPAFLEKEKH